MVFHVFNALDIKILVGHAMPKTPIEILQVLGGLVGNKGIVGIPWDYTV